mgnify:CR=1 FL=1
MRLMIVALGSLALGGARAADEPVTPSPYEVVNPLFPALRSGHRLSQRPSSQKQIPSNSNILWPKFGGRLITDN